MSLIPHWQPSHGTQAGDLDLRLISRIPDPAQRAAVFTTAGQILGHGPQPNSSDPSVTGLALGYVQSGKTTSFTALSALAADNGYKVVIAFLGKTTLLTDLNTGELRGLLGMEAVNGWEYRWTHFPQPTTTKTAAATQALQAGQVLLITLLKWPSHIRNVTEMLAQIPEIQGAPTLVIDDEADQASLNTGVAKLEVSSTYGAIRDLTQALGPHLYVQYTATPFAPLLLDASDQLSPTFVEQLTPGLDYTGGEAFFVDRAADLVRTVDDGEAADDKPAHLPAGLRSALGSFFVGTALAKSGNVMQPPVSMLVHPSHLREVHRDYYNLVVSAHQDWRTRLHRPSGDPGRDEDLKQLRAHYDNFIAHGAQTAVSWDDLVPDLVWVLDNTRFWLVNSDGDARSISWDQARVHVLVGGNILDRGFVIKGLTTTYLTRDSQVSQADTTEQRARCFGYKRKYLDYCRFYAPASVTRNFTDLVHTEADLRARLLDHVASGQPLASWATDVGLVLPPNMKPTRSNVLPPVFRTKMAGPFHSMRTPSLDPPHISHNDALVQALGLLTAPLMSFGKIKHRVLEDVDVDTVVLPLLRQWAPGPTPGFPLDQLALYLERSNDAGTLGPMNVLCLDNNGQPRRHQWRDDTIGMSNLLQGLDAGTGYPGDLRLLPGVPQLQVHYVEAIDDHRQPISSPLYTLVLHIPESTFPPSVVVQQ